MGESENSRRYAIGTGIPFLRRHKKVYVLCYHDSDHLPAVSVDGAAMVFTRKIYARIAVAKDKNVRMIEFKMDEFDKYVKRWYAAGIQSFCLNMGTKDHCCVIMRDDYLPDDTAKKFAYNGSALSYYLWQFMNYWKYAENNTEIMKFLNRMHGCISHELGETLFLCINGKIEKSDSVNPYLLLGTTPGSVKLIKKKFLETLGDPELIAMANTCEFEIDGKLVLPEGQIRIYSDKKYTIIMTQDETIPFKSQNIWTGKADGESEVIAVFTNVNELWEFIKADDYTRPFITLFTYDELCDILEERPELGGIAINPMSIKMVLKRDGLELIEKLRKQDRSVFEDDDRKVQ